MALAQQPRLLLLDEPTQGLSVEETAQAVDTLATLLADRAMTVLLVEHDMEVVFRLAHMITVLHRGAVIADGTYAQIYAKYLGEEPGPAFQKGSTGLNGVPTPEATEAAPAATTAATEAAATAAATP